jgi:hypothetical protein
LVARWPHGCRRQCSEVAVPALVGSNLTEGGGIFSKEETSAGPWMCVYVFQGLTVGWWKEERHSSDTTSRSSRVQIPGRMGLPWMVCAVFRVVLSKKEKRRREAGRGWPGKVPRSPVAHKGKKREEKTSRPQGT